MYILHLAVQLQPYRMQQSSAASGNSSVAAQASSPLSQLLQGSHELRIPDEGLTRLLEKAYALCAETCLVPDAASSWNALVDPCLRAVITFSPPAVLSQLTDNALGPEVFSTYATAYLWALGSGNAADLAKLHSIQQALRRKGIRRSANQTEALQALSAALPAAMQMAFERQLSRLEPQVDAMLQKAAHSAASMPQPDISAEVHLTPELATGLQGAPQTAAAVPAQPIDQAVDAIQIDPTADTEMAEAADQTSDAVPQHEAALSDQADRPETAVARPAAVVPAAIEPIGATFKQLQTAVFEMLKKCHTWWKSNVGKATDAAQQGFGVDKTKADELLCRCVYCLVYAQQDCARSTHTAFLPCRSHAHTLSLHLCSMLFWSMTSLQRKVADAGPKLPLSSILWSFLLS